ncbi:MAG: hypothetical protein JWR14_6513 [Caballeronia sp.]|jgi:hypothetical protein|uniref:hypothetical protein n=1 Tax=Caballeronia sp. TaxID=1931223 RepID=UPI002603B323|nr:hypothetical protein [Caballeronia sp.]MDB5836683.1 hypothetical protein [Caballeronia sp.]
MSRAAISIKAFAVYAFVVGAGLVVAPNGMLGVFGIPHTTEVWIRVVGVLAFNIGAYYWCAAKCEIKAFFRATVYTRGLVVLLFTAFVFLGWASPALMVFVTVELFGAVWTHLALRSERRHS